MPKFTMSKNRFSTIIFLYLLLGLSIVQQKVRVRVAEQLFSVINLKMLQNCFEIRISNATNLHSLFACCCDFNSEVGCE